jgi:indole-3-glycerol phosphate synthase
VNILYKIVERKRGEVVQQLAALPVDQLPKRLNPVRDFQGALAQPGLQIIAEVKGKSPSMGTINAQLDPALLARQYEAGGAAAISVLTDAVDFGGELEHIKLVREAVALPVLRKDFIIDSYQVRESFAHGADAILLIADILTEENLEELYTLAWSLGLHVLVEGYADEALQRIHDLGPAIGGINARDLASMELDLDNMIQRRSHLPPGTLAVAESGVTTHADLQKVAAGNFDAVLIGTALAGAADPTGMLQSMVEAVRPVL